ncbi:MAG: hypothetical protein M1524_03540 [Patescibacteria group bacterium]|nr:hypothetical protein [Patescibacteria group bacterium]
MLLRKIYEIPILIKLLFLFLIIVIPIGFLLLKLSINKQRENIPKYEKPTPIISSGLFPTTKLTPAITDPELKQIKVNNTNINNVHFPSVYNTTLYYYSSKENNFKTASLDNLREKTLSDNINLDIEFIRDITWSQDKKHAILTIENDKYRLRNIRSNFLSEDDEDLALTKWVYNLETKNIKKIDTSINSPVFSPDGKFILYYILDQDTSQSVFYTSTIDGSFPQKIISFPGGEYMASSISNNNFILSPVSEFQTEQSIYYLLDIANKNFRTIEIKGLAYGANNSQNNKYFLFQKLINKDRSLMLYDLEINQERRMLNNAVIEKTLWINNIIYTFVGNDLYVINPVSLNSNHAILPGGLSESAIDSSSIIFVPQYKNIYYTTQNKLGYLSF